MKLANVTMASYKIRQNIIKLQHEFKLIVNQIKKENKY
jgi:hypothetical protein